MTVLETMSNPYDNGDRRETLAAQRIQSFTRQEAEQEPSLNRLYDGFLKLRTQFVAEQGWLPEQTDDTDEYDTDPNTRYVVTLDERGEVAAGMRLTQVSDIYNSLSFGMWRGPIERDQPHTTAGLESHQGILHDLNEEAKNGRVWDLSRLVSRGSLEENRDNLRERVQDYKNILHLFGAGSAISGMDSYWIYTTSIEVNNFLAHAHLPNIKLLEDRITPTDAEPASFCVTAVGHACAVQDEESARGSRLRKEGYEIESAHVRNGI